MSDLTYDVDAEDYAVLRDAIRLWTRTPKWIERAPAVLLSVPLLALAAVLLGTGQVVVGLVFAGILALLWCSPLLGRWWVHRTSLRDARAYLGGSPHHRWQLALESDGVRLTGPNYEVKYGWSLLVAVHRTPRHALILGGGGPLFALPLRPVASGDVERVLAALTAKLRKSAA
jgi:hypothetical protein